MQCAVQGIQLMTPMTHSDNSAMTDVTGLTVPVTTEGIGTRAHCPVHPKLILYVNCHLNPNKQMKRYEMKLMDGFDRGLDEVTGEVTGEVYFKGNLPRFLSRFLSRLRLSSLKTGRSACVLGDDSLVGIACEGTDLQEPRCSTVPL